MLTEYHMKGGGFYNAHSTPQLESIKQCLPLVDAAIRDLTLQHGTVRTLDVGCSEGGNATYLQQFIVQGLLSRGAKSIQPTFADLPSNDFNQVFSKLFPGGQSAFGEGNVLPAVVGGSAYDRLVPDASIHLATTFNMLGWRASPPTGQLKNTLFPVLPTPYGKPVEPQPDPDEIAAVHAQAEADLIRFFRMRAQEIVPGGKLLAQVFGNNDTGGSVAHGWTDAINDVAREMVAEGKIEGSAFDEYIFPVVWRTLDEFVAPLKSDPVLREAFKIEETAFFEVPVSFNQKLKETGDVFAWAAEFSGIFRAVTETSLTPLFARENTAEIAEELWARVEQQFVNDPERYQFHYYSNAVLLTRR